MGEFLQPPFDLTRLDLCVQNRSSYHKGKRVDGQI